MGSETPLEDSLVESIRVPDLADAIADVGEIGLDRLFDEGLARDVPIIGTLIRLGKTIGAIRDFVFTRKVIRFLAPGTGLVAFKFYPTSYGMSGGSFSQTELGQRFLQVIDATDNRC